MVRSKKILILIELALACALAIDSFVQNIVSQNFITLVLGSLFIILVLTFRFEAENHRYNSDSIYSITIFILSYYVLVYFLGAFIGFTRSSMDLSAFSIFKNVLQIGLYILASEMFRYMVVRNSGRSKIVLTLLVIVLSLCDTSDYIFVCNFMDISDTVELFGYYIIPRLITNGLLTYIALKVGYKPTIVYRYLLELPLYFLPFSPSLGQYGQIIVNIMIPVVVSVYFYRKFRKRNKALFYTKYRWVKYVAMILIMAPIFAGVVLTSGLFKYYAVAVGSESMTPNICKGDEVIVKKLGQNELKELKKGDILVYKNADRVIVHRIQDISFYNGEYYFYTKGDYNNSADSYSTNQSDVIGVAAAKIPWIGIPTVWIKHFSNF